MTLLEKVEFIKNYYEGRANDCLEEIARCERSILADVQCKHPSINDIECSAKLAQKCRDGYMIYEDVVNQLTALINTENEPPKERE